MDMSDALAAFGALSQPTRLAALRLLIQAGPEGLLSGEIGVRLGGRQNTVSANLAQLLAAGLIRNERQGRTVRYFADMEGMRSLIAFLLQDCCGGRPELCRPLLDALVTSC